MIAPAAALGANVLGNMVAAPLLPTRPDRSAPLAGVISGDSTRWQDYGWESSRTPGPQVTVLGAVQQPARPPVQPARGEPVPIEHPNAKPQELRPDGQQAGAGRVYDQTVILPTEPDKDNGDKQPSSTNAPPPVEDTSAMNQSMLVGAVAGALVAKQTGYNWLLGGAAGALVGHWYALPKAGA